MPIIFILNFLISNSQKKSARSDKSILPKNVYHGLVTRKETELTMNLTQLGQISLTVDNVNAAERFYGEALGLQKLYRFGNLVFFDCGGVRLFITEPEEGSFSPESSILYFQTSDMAADVQELKEKGVSFIHEPHLVSEMEDHDLWMAFFKDPAGNTLALMYEAPKGVQPSL